MTRNEVIQGLIDYALAYRPMSDVGRADQVEVIRAARALIEQGDDVPRQDNTELSTVRCTALGVYFDSNKCGYPNCKCERVYRQRDNSDGRKG